MQRPLVVISAAMIFGACAAPEGTGETSGAIIGGSTDNADPAIVELVMVEGDGEGTCTATFIATTVLLPATHCVVDEKNPKLIPPKATFKVMLSASAAAAKTADYITVPLANVHPHPHYDGNGANDLAIVVLDNPVDVMPIPIGRTALTTDDVGKRVRLVGYGMAKRSEGAHDGSGRKRTVTTAIMTLPGDLVGIGSSNGQSCNGDSGGPALLSIAGGETLIATDDVAATRTNCAGGDLYQRTDLHLDFIDQYLPLIVAPSQTTPVSGTHSEDGGATDPCQDPSGDSLLVGACPTDGGL